MILSPKEHSEILKISNDERIRKFLYTQHFISIKEHLEFVERLKKDLRKKYCAIYYCGKFLGSVNFENKGQEVEFGFYANPNIAGLGRVMEQISLFYAFYIMNSKKLILEVFYENSRVINLHKKFGFIVYREFYRGEKKVLKMYLENKLNNKREN